MSQVDEVRDRADIVEVVGEHVQLKRAGQSFKGLCPFHDERTPSFVVFPDSGNWRCFGACSIGGDVFDFVMRIEGLDFRGALEHLARRVGVNLEPPSPAKVARKERRDRLREATAAAAEIFHHRLMRGTDPGAEAARAYLAERALDSEVARAFGLGYAPDSWQATGDALRERGFEDEILLGAGLLRERDDGGTYDAFRGRLIIPIHNLRGEPIAFGARTMDPDGVPKYINSPQTDLFDKGRMLYGMDRAKSAIRESGEAVIVEGYTDVIRAHAAGFRNVVASLGTALTEHHLLLVKRFAKRAILALDADEAGQRATLRGLTVAQSAQGEDERVMATPRGVVRLVGQLEVELRVAIMPEGADPDDIIREDPGRWSELIEQSRGLMDHVFDTQVADLDLRDGQEKLVALERTAPFLLQIDDQIARSAWMDHLAQKIKIDRTRIAGYLAGQAAERGRRGRSGRRGSSGVPGPGSGPAPGPGHGGDGGSPPPAFPGGTPGASPDDGSERAEGGAPSSDERWPQRVSGRSRAAEERDPAAWLLGHLLLQPRRLLRLNQQLRSDDLKALSSDDMERATDRDLMIAIGYGAHGVAPPDAPPAHRLDALPEEHAAYAARLRHRCAGEPSIAEPVLEKHLRNTVIRLRIRSARLTLEGLRFLQAESEPDERSELDRRVKDVTSQLRTLQRLANPRGNRTLGKRDRAVQ